MNESLKIFEAHESGVRSYCRSFPVTFERAEGCELVDTEGRRYIDFLAGAGALNYGHNPEPLRQPLIDHIERCGVTHGLDMYTDAKARFLELFAEHVLDPAGLGEHVVQFTGPTGANAVEAALKLARKVTGRSNVVTFTNGYHGVTLGALAATGQVHHRGCAGVPLSGAQFVPYDGYLGDGVDTAALLEKLITDRSSGLDLPAAVILETVQGEGGLNVASFEWLRRVQAVCRRHGVLLIVDDIQAGCGRTGTFFSFEPAGIRPDIVTLSKSISGYGLPMALTLFDRKLDVWSPGEHNGTFRGNNLAFVTAAAAIEHYWTDERFARGVRARAAETTRWLDAMVARAPRGALRRKGRGLMQGLECADGDTAEAISRAAFEKGLIIESSGSEGQVLKCLVPLVISEATLANGMRRLADAVAQVVPSRLRAAS